MINTKRELEVPTVSQEVLKLLRNQLINGEIRPGEQITIRKLAVAYGVSTMPVREALMKLEAEGFVTISRKSIVVNKLSPKDVIEIFSIRKNLEKLAIEWSILEINEKDLESLENRIQEMDQQLDNHSEWRKLNKLFHFELYSHCHSKPLLELLSQLWGKVEFYMNMYTSKHYLSIAQKEHYKIIEYVKKKDINQLVDLVNRHIDATCQAILKEMGG